MDDLYKLGYIGCQTNVPVAPSYAYVQENDWRDCYINEPTSPWLYPHTNWKLGQENLFSTLANNGGLTLRLLELESNAHHLSNIQNRVVFYHPCQIGKSFVMRTHYNNHKFCGTDECNIAFAYIYCTATKVLHCVGLRARLYADAMVNILHPSLYDEIFHFKIQYLLAKWRRLTPYIGKIALVIRNLYTEVAYRPGNSGAVAAQREFRINLYKMNGGAGVSPA